MAMSDRDLLELIAAKVVGVEGKVDGLETRMDRIEGKVDGLEIRMGGLETRMDKMDRDVQEIKKTVIHIENAHGDKLSALFDGYYQHTDMLERITQEISKHEEVILRRIQ